jgi:hypothetical protein
MYDQEPSIERHCFNLAVSFTVADAQFASQTTDIATMVANVIQDPSERNSAGARMAQRELIR